MLTRPKITEELLDQIRQTIESHPDWGRTRISIHLCELWDWRIPGLGVKDISCRDMLRDLDRAGRIRLPASQNTLAQSPRRSIERLSHDTTPIVCGLDELRPLVVEAVESGCALAEFKSLLVQHHYLHYNRTVGENMKYIVRSKNGTILACLLFGAAAWKCQDRDAYLGWNQEQRSSRLFMLTDNVRFLIPEWVKVPCLASHTLSLVARRISADWETKYGHGLACLETFVERNRFRGVVYRAANWTHVGVTAGRGRNDRQHERALSEKDIYLLPLGPGWRNRLLGERE